MKQQVDNLIANILLDEGAVYLPEVGSLVMLRHPAELLSKKAIQRPYRELTFSRERQGESISSHIAEVAKVTEERAIDIYGEWLSQSLHNNTLTIGGVCIIEGDKVQINEQFDKAANPDGCNILPLKPRKNPWTATLITLFIGGAICGAGHYFYSEGALDKLINRHNVAAVTEVEVAPTVETPIVETEVKDSTLHVEIEPMPTDSTMVDVRDTIAIATVIIEDDTSADSVVTVDPIAQTPQKKIEPTAKPAKRSTSQNAKIPSVRRGYSYAVWGVYDKLQNAKETRAWLKRKFPSLKVVVYRYDKRYMVAIYSSTSRDACARKVKSWKAKLSSFKNVWVYTRQ